MQFTCSFAFQLDVTIKCFVTFEKKSYNQQKGSLGTEVKLLPCDHEVMSSSSGNLL
jgi:hypothetical protein